MKKWPEVALGEVLRHRKVFTVIDDTQVYKRCRVQLYAQGIILRDGVSGADIKTKKQQVCRAGDFLVAEIDAKMGGFGIIPDALEGAIVSSHYFLFEVDTKRMDKRYLDYVCRTQQFRNQVKAQGSTNYSAIRPADVLTYTVPLPPLPKQQTILARLDALAEKTQQVQEHLIAAERAAERLLALHLLGKIEILKNGSCNVKKWPKVTLAEICTPTKRHTSPVSGETYRQLGVRLWGEGAYERDSIDGADTKYAYFNRIETNDLVVNKIWARNGAIAMATPEQAGTYVSAEFPVFSLDSARITPDWMRQITKWPIFWAACDEKARGTSGKNRIKPAQFLSIEIPLPSLSVQQSFTRLQTAVAALKARHAAIATANAALLPAVLERLFKHTDQSHSAR